MKKILLWAVLLIAGILIGKYCCCGTCQEQTAAPVSENIVESQTITGLWQKQRTVEIVDEESGESLEGMEATNLYKCIMSDGTYILFRAKTDATGLVGTSSIEHFGSYALTEDGLCIETIAVCLPNPALNGTESQVKYQILGDKNEVMQVSYNLNTGEEGSNEWQPETWHRVGK